MRLRSIAITDFLGIESATVAFGSVTSVAGLNWSGKTSLRQAIRLIVSGMSERGITLATKQNANRHLLVRAGADAARIICETDTGTLEANISASRNYETQRRETMLPVCQDDLLPHTLNPNGYSGADDEDRKKILFWLAAKSYDPEQIKARLVEAKFDDEKIDRLMPNLISGKFDAAVNMCEINIKKCRSDWGQITGETYGDKKYKTWAAPEFDEKESDLKEAQLAVEQCQKTVERLEAAKPEPFECDTCKKTLIEITPETQKAEKTLAIERDQLAGWQQAVVEISTKLEHNARAQEKTEKALKRGDDLNEWKAIKKMLGPDGIQGEVLTSVIDSLNERLSAISIFEKTLHIDKETCNPIVNGRPYLLASEAEQFLADAYIQKSIAIMSGANLALIDRFDVLHPSLRATFLKELIGDAQLDGLQTVVFGTLKKPIKFAGVDSYWMSAGKSMLAPEDQ